MARRIGFVRPKFPPKKIDISEANTSKFKSLELPKDGDSLMGNITEKELIGKKQMLSNVPCIEKPFND